MEPGGSATEHKMMGQHHLTSIVASCPPLPPSGKQDPPMARSNACRIAMIPDIGPPASASAPIGDNHHCQMMGNLYLGMIHP